jgi:putative oxidoreductase
MSRPTPVGSALSVHALALLRIVAGFLFFSHGVQKLLGLFGGLGGHGAAAPTGSMFWIAGLIETVGSVLIITGAFTRPVAFILCGEMAAAYLLVHAKNGWWPIQNGGEHAVLYCFFFLYLTFSGAGSPSIDSFRQRR